jgi:hypothetical protein
MQLQVFRVGSHDTALTIWIDLPIFFISNNRELNEADKTKLVNLPVVFVPVHARRKQDKFLVQMYGENVRPTVDTVLRQLAIVECCHPGFELDVIRFVEPFDEEKTIATAKCVYLNEGMNILGQLCSLLASNEATESDDQIVIWRNHGYDEYEKATLLLFRTKIDIDLTYATNQTQFF